MLIVLAAISAAVLARATERTPQWQVAMGTLAGAAALTCYRLAAHLTADAHSRGARRLHRGDADRHRRVRAPGPALPDGRLTRPPQ